MTRSRLLDALPSLVVALLALVYVWASYEYAPGSRHLPWIAGALAATLALVDATARLRKQPASGDGAHGSAPQAPHREAIALAWIGAFVPLVIALGFYGAIPLYVFCYLRLYAGKPGLISAATAFGVSGFLYLLFGVFMGYEIFGGVLAGQAL